jgi:dTDP-4-dehydrorhamnose reductase
MVTLIGHGYVGNYIAKELQKHKVQFSWVDHKTIPLNTDFIINAAGYTGSPNVDACENNKQACIDGNVVFPLDLEYRFTRTPILHISSGCIYTGYKDGGWTEEDPPNFGFDNGSFYSASKMLAQRLLQPFMDKSYLFRIRMPFGPDKHDKNLLTKLNKYDKLVSYMNSLSQVQEVAQAAVYFALTRPTPGIYNAVNPGSMTTKEIADMMGLNKEWMEPSEFLASVKAPRSNCVLSTEKMQKVFEFSDVRPALYDTLSKIGYK